MSELRQAAAVLVCLLAAPLAAASAEGNEPRIRYPGLVLSGSRDVVVESVAVVMGGNAERTEVKYVLANTGDTVATVDVSWEYPRHQYSPVLGVPETDYFRVSVENGTFRPRRIVKAYVGSDSAMRDVTALLRGCGISIEDAGGLLRGRVISPDGGQIENDSELGSLSKKCTEELSAVGAIDEVWPRWWIAVSYAWQQQVAPTARTKVVLKFEQVGDDLSDGGSVSSVVAEAYAASEQGRLARRSVSSGWLLGLVPVAHRSGRSLAGPLQVKAVGSSACRPILLSPRGAKWPTGIQLEHKCSKCSFEEPVTVVFACGRP